MTNLFFASGKMHLSRFCLSVIAGLLFLLSSDKEIGAQQPHIVLINLDDADRDMFRADILESKFQSIHEIAKNGMTFTRFYVCTPKCGPSRASLMRGQYAHAINHRTNEISSLVNRGFTGGFPVFQDQGFFNDDFGQWIKNAGYETVFMGKYLNGIRSDNIIPTGWDHYYLSRGSTYYETTRFTNRDKEDPKYEVLPPNKYRTDAEVDDIVRIINGKLSSQKPFLIYFAPLGPHTEGRAAGGMIDKELEDLWPRIKAVRQADYNEKNNSDKPLAYRQLPSMTFEDELEAQVEHRKRMIAVKSVDNGIRRIVNALKAKGLYDNTYFFITSDNGFVLGQHRISGKATTLSRSSHVPLIVSGPGITPNTNHDALTSQIDLAPTFLELAGADTKPFFDGKSLAPLLFQDHPQHSVNFRNGLLVENWELRRFWPFVLGTTYTQLRTATESYTEWSDGTVEYYDHAVDPLELLNRASRLTNEQVADFRQKISELRRPMTEPLVTFETPMLDYETFTGPPFHLNGVAEDSSRIIRVSVVIINEQTREYWNGSSWQENRKVLNADLENHDGILSDWNLEFAPPTPTNRKESYVAVARAYANNGNFTKKVEVRKFKFDSLKPVTTMNSTVVGANNRVHFSGTAVDNLEVKHVELIIQNRTTGEYMNGTSWQTKRQGIRLTPDEDDKWQWTSPVFEPGSYVVRARSVDAAGNFETKPVVELFSVN